MNRSRRSKLRDDLRADATRCAALAERHGTPLLVLQPDVAARRYRQLAARLPGFRLHYAVKASPHPVVLSTIAICGGGFDVATSAEVDLLQHLGLPMDRCIHTNPIKKPSDIDHAYGAGIRTPRAGAHHRRDRRRDRRRGPTPRSRRLGSTASRRRRS
jgi:ornithine decarboxylase